MGLGLFLAGTRPVSPVQVEFNPAAVAAYGFAELLRQSPYATGYSLGDVATEATSLLPSSDGQPDVVEFVHLAQAAAY